MIFDGSPDFNYGFHNHTDIEFTAAEQQLLGYGHKFVIAGFGPSAKQLTAALRVMNRRLFLRDYFYQKEAIEGKSTLGRPPDKRLSVKNPHFHPQLTGMIQHPGESQPRRYVPNEHMIMFMNDLADRLQENLKIVRRQPIKDNLSVAQREAVTRILEDLDLVLTEADKNKGWVAMRASDYEAMGLRMLQKSHVVCEETQQEILNRIQQRFADVLEAHTVTLDEWSNNPADAWRAKYFIASVTQHPQTRDI